MTAVCAICHEGLAQAHTHTLRCGHTLHASCLINWFSRGQPHCPLCRDDQAQYHAQLPRYALMVRGRYLRAKYARRRSAPHELRRRIAAVRDSERAYTEHRARVRQFRAEHREVIRTHETLMQKAYSCRWKVNDAIQLLGLYNDAAEMLPAVVVDHG